MKLTTQIPSSTSSNPSLWPAMTVEMLIFFCAYTGQPDMHCMSTHGTWSVNGMALMYALMSIFHATPWIKLIKS